MDPMLELFLSTVHLDFETAFLTGLEPSPLVVI